MVDYIYLMLTINRCFNIVERTLSRKGLKVDREKNIIYGVKIIGFESDNGRRYTKEALKEAISLYENVKVNVDHPKDPSDTRSAYDRIGKLINVKFVEGKGLFGDLWLIPSHKITPEIFDSAELMPDLFGLSHNAQGEGETDKEDIFVVRKITEVRHVDIVADPATTKALNEGVRPVKKKKFREEEETEKEKDKMEADEYGDKETTEDDDKDDIGKKVLDAMQEADTSDEDKANKIVELVKEALKMEGEEDTPEAEGEEEEDSVEKDDTTEAEEDDEDEETTESRQGKKFNKPARQSLQEQINSMKKADYVKSLCYKLKMPCSKELLEDVKSLPRKTIQRHLARLSLAHAATKPRSGIQINESIKSRIPTGDKLYNWMQN